MALTEATPAGYNLKGQFRIASRHEKSWPHLVIVNGRLYLRDQHQLHCYDIRKSQGSGMRGGARHRLRDGRCRIPLPRP